jgi:hypothetical protein
MHTDRRVYTCRQKCGAKGGGEEVKIQELIHRDTTNVEPEMYDYTINNLEAVPRKHSIDSLQQTAILGTAHIIRKALQCEA